MQCKQWSSLERIGVSLSSRTSHPWELSRRVASRDFISARRLISLSRRSVTAGRREPSARLPSEFRFAGLAIEPMNYYTRAWVAGLSGPGNGRSIWRARARRVRGTVAFTVRVNARRRVDAYGDRGGRAFLLFPTLPFPPSLFHPLSAFVKHARAAHRDVHLCMYTGRSGRLSLRRVTAARREYHQGISFAGPTWRRLLAYGKAKVLDRPPSYEELEGLSSFAFKIWRRGKRTRGRDSLFDD